MYSKTGNNYKGAGRRIISLVLAIALICSFGLTSVFAETTVEYDSGVIDSGVGTITVSLTEETIAIGAKTGATAEITVRDSGTKDTVTWSSSHPSIAIVDTTGIVTGVAIGTADIIATADADGKIASAAIEVTAAQPTAVGFTDLTANGADGTTTTELKITLDKVVAGLSADDITVTGAIKGTLTSDTAPIYKLAISDIKVNDGEHVKVTLAKNGFNFTIAEKYVAVFKAPPTPTKVTISVGTVPTASDVTEGNALSTSTLIGGKVIETGKTDAIAGTWAWTDGSTTVTETGKFEATFTPDVVSGTTFTPATLKAQVDVTANAKEMDYSLKIAFDEAKDAVDKLTVTNDTTADSILNIVNTAITNEYVTTKWTAEFKKVAATTEKTGLITGTIEVRLDDINQAYVNISKEIAKLPTPPVVNKKALSDAITEANTAKTGIVTSVNGTDVAKDKKWVTLAVNTAFDTAITAAQAVANKTTATQAEIETAVTTLNAAKEVYVKAQALGTYTPSSSTGTSSGGSSSGGGTASTPSVDAPSSNVGGSGEVKSEDIKAETSKAVADAVKAAPGATANVTVKNADNITPTALKEMAAAATAAGGKAQLSADTVVNGVIETRLYINPALAATLTAPIKLGVSTNSLEIDATKAKFANFDNNIAVASFAQQGSFGMKIQAAVKLDLTTLNTKTLVFYSYDKATNTYTPIVAPAYTIDKNGYLHFSTTVGGDIIITDKALAKK